MIGPAGAAVRGRSEVPPPAADGRGRGRRRGPAARRRGGPRRALRDAAVRCALVRRRYPTSLLPDEVEYVVATADGSLGHRGRCSTSCSTTRPGRTRRSRPDRRRCSTRSRRLAVGRRGRLGVATLGRKRGGGRPPAAGSPEARRKAWLQVLVQAAFGCAAGTCLGCVVAGASGPVRACREGPAFAARRARVGADVKAKRRALTAKPGSSPRTGADADGPPDQARDHAGQAEGGRPAGIVAGPAADEAATGRRRRRASAGAPCRSRSTSGGGSCWRTQ